MGRTVGHLHHHDTESFTICDEKGGFVALCDAAQKSDEHNEENAYRLIECWNACEELSEPGAVTLLLRGAREAIECCGSSSNWNGSTQKFLETFEHAMALLETK